MPRPTLCPSTPMLFEEDRVAVTPLRSGFRLGSMMEFVGYDRSLPAHRLDYLRKIAERYLREPYTEPIEERWFGWRPMTPDGVPIIDRAGWGNVYLAAGHNMLGLSMAPATGKLVAEMLSGEETHINLDPYRLARFA
ncbi:MAG: FAD-binding oxidoreductase [Gemmataceae bacterium]